MIVMQLLWLSLSLVGVRSATPQESVQSGFVEVDGARLYYEQAGSGTPVVMIHGGFLDHHMWDGQFTLVADRYRAIRYDVRAHGQSSSDSVPFADHEDLRHLLDTLAVPRAVIVGLSMGGKIAIDFALADPDRVAALVLVGSGLSGFEPKSDQIARYLEDLQAAIPLGFPAIYETFTRWFCDGPYRQPSEVDPVVRQQVLEMLAGSEQRWRYSGLERGLEPPALGRLGEIRVPTLVVVGTLDVRDIHQIADLIVEQVPGAERVEIPGVAHMVNMEKPAEFNTVLMEFLGDIDAE